MGAGAEEIVFTSGGTEGNDLAIRGLLARPAPARGARGPHVVSSRLEHPSVPGALAAAEVDVAVAVDADGRIDAGGAARGAAA